MKQKIVSSLFKYLFASMICIIGLASIGLNRQALVTGWVIFSLDMIVIVCLAWLLLQYTEMGFSRGLFSMLLLTAKFLILGIGLFTAISVFRHDVVAVFIGALVALLSFLAGVIVFGKKCYFFPCKSDKSAVHSEI